MELVETSDPMYLVSRCGEVYSKFTEKFLKKSLSKGTGYYVVNIRKDGKRVPEYIHRLVAKAYIPNPFDLPEVNHKNGIKTDSYEGNLEWCTQLENNKHAQEMRLIKKGSQLKRSKLNEDQVHVICTFFELGLSCGDILGRVDFYVTRYLLLNIRSRRDWVSVSKNYSWRQFSNRRNGKAK